MRLDPLSDGKAVWRGRNGNKLVKLLNEDLKSLSPWVIYELNGKWLDRSFRPGLYQYLQRLRTKYGNMERVYGKFTMCFTWIIKTDASYTHTQDVKRSLLIYWWMIEYIAVHAPKNPKTSELWVATFGLRLSAHRGQEYFVNRNHINRKIANKNDFVNCLSRIEISGVLNNIYVDTIIDTLQFIIPFYYFSECCFM